MYRARLPFLVLLVVLPVLGSAREAAGRSPLAWKVGRDDFVNYRITVLERHEEYARWGSIDDVAGFHGYELDRQGRRVERDITHLELLYVPFVFALPSQARRDAKESFDDLLGGNWRVEPFRARGDVHVKAGADETGTAGIELEGEVKFQDVRRDGDDHAYRQLCEGRLAWKAGFDTDRQLMTWVEYELTWVTAAATRERPRGVHAVRDEDRRFRERIRLDLDRVLAYRYPGFQRDVDAAIEEGLAFLESRQGKDGAWEGGQRAVGMTALALLALLDGGRSAEAPAVERGFAWLLRQRPWEPMKYRTRTYTIGIALMALERLRTPEVEIDRRRRGIATDFLPRRLRGMERAWMMRCVGFLLDTARVANRTDPDKPVTGRITDERWRWRYPREVNGVDPIPPTDDDFDNSNTQYAVLGLESAARCGIPIPGRAWYGIANHFLEVQAPDGPAHENLRIERQTLEDPAAPGPTRRGHDYAPERVRARMRGWNYSKVEGPEPVVAASGRPYGSMTTAGIASLAIARSRIASLEGVRRRDPLLEEIDQAILDGFASLDNMFTVWTNPCYEGWYTYYLYGLERAGMLTAVKRFGRHDWYWEGAVQLLLRQSTYAGRANQGPKHWVYDLGAVGTTCWAILFLKRGTPPVVTPR